MKLIACALVTGLVATAAADPKKLTAADCAPLVAKLWPVVQELAKAAGKPVAESERTTFVDECKKAIAKDPDHADPMLVCVAAAADTPAVKACMAAATQAYADKAKRTEAPLNLNKLGKNAKIYFITSAQFPVGKASTLPEKPCCPQANHRCAVSKAWAKDPVWAALDFQIDDPNLFQYTYTSLAPGLTFKATATGDVSCSGKPVTYTLDGKIVDGNPVVTLTEPQ